MAFLSSTGHEADAPANDYWDDVEAILDMAARKGLDVGLLPTWGRYVMSDTGGAQKYGEFIGRRFKDKTNLIWILGGDRPATTPREQAVWRAMAKGVTIGVCGEDYDAVMMT